MLPDDVNCISRCLRMLNFIQLGITFYSFCKRLTICNFYLMTIW